MSLSQVIFLFCAYFGLAGIKHAIAKSKLSLFKFFPYFPDVVSLSLKDRSINGYVHVEALVVLSLRMKADKS